MSEVPRPNPGTLGPGETFLGGLPESTRAAIGAGSTTHAFRAGSIIFADTETRVGIALAGVVRTFLTAANGRQLTIRYVPVGGLIGGPASVGHLAVSVEAVTDCMITELDAAVLSNAIRTDPAVASVLVGELGRHLEAAYGALAASAFGSMRQRIARHLLELARPDGQRLRLVASVAQQQLADGAGTAREVVARVLGQFRAEGLIRTGAGQIEIRDAARLASLVGVWPMAAAGGLGDRSSVGERFLDASPNAIVGVNTEGAITYLNPSAEIMFGSSRAELAGAAVHDLVPRRLRDRHAAHVASFMAQPSARPMGIGLDLVGRRRDGREFPVEIGLVPIRTQVGSLVFATVADIRARNTRSRTRA